MDIPLSYILTAVAFLASGVGIMWKYYTGKDDARDQVREAEIMDLRQAVTANTVERVNSEKECRAQVVALEATVKLLDQDFRQYLINEAQKSVQVIAYTGARISGFEAKIDQIMDAMSLPVPDKAPHERTTVTLRAIVSQKSPQ